MFEYPSSFRRLFFTGGILLAFGLIVVTAQKKGASRPEDEKEKRDTTVKTTPTPKKARTGPEPVVSKSYRSQRPSIELVWVPPGEFVMGNDKGGPGEAPAHPVALTKGFFLGKFEITQAQWTAVMGYNLSEFRGPNLPVDNVSWERVQAFLERLNRLDTRYRYRLPTEAEWEYACRAGTTTDFAGVLDEMAWHADNLADTPAEQRTHPVGAKKPNAWGLYDMHGNVWEWCQDWLDFTYYTADPATDPPGPATGLTKVYRGGAWDQFPRAARSSSRYGDQTDHRDAALGFRVAADKRE